jgi:hypothetical protein
MTKQQKPIDASLIRRFAVAFLTFGLLVVSGVTCGVLVKQWQTFEKTDQTLRAQERAFIYVDKFDFNTTPQERTITTIWRNSGSTQATDVFLYVNWKLFEDEIPPIYGLGMMGFRQKNKDITLVPDLSRHKQWSRVKVL